MITNMTNYQQYLTDNSPTAEASCFDPHKVCLTITQLRRVLSLVSLPRDTEVGRLDTTNCGSSLGSTNRTCLLLAEEKKKFHDQSLVM